MSSIKTVDKPEWSVAVIKLLYEGTLNAEILFTRVWVQWHVQSIDVNFGHVQSDLSEVKPNEYSLNWNVNKLSCRDIYITV